MATSEGIPSSIDIELLELNDNPYIIKGACGLGAYKGAAERRLTGGRKYAPKGNGKDEKEKKDGKGEHQKGEKSMQKKKEKEEKREKKGMGTAQK